MKNNFTPIPFWFWNDELSKDEIKRQMLEMKEKGVDGFVIHPRKGMPRTIEYMGPVFLDFVKYAVELAKELEMMVVLYDEAMYPSGSAHGQVVKENPEYASKGLEQNATPNGTSYQVVFSQGTIRGIHENEDDGEALAPKSADLLNPDAVQAFIRLTHEKYYAALKPYFGTTIIAIFTDEPCILGRYPKPGIIPWTDGFMDELTALGFEEKWLGYLFADDGSADSLKTNNIYKKAIHDRMAKAYYTQLHNWCQAHGIGLMGHPEKSTDIGYMQYFDYPCQDIVWRNVAPENKLYVTGSNSCLGKCSSDAARHRGILRNGNECFGCCGHTDDPYAFTEEDMRWYLNWLFVRGVNLIIPHAFYYSLRGNRGAERPPEVGLNNPFWPNYGKVSSYIKGMCALLTGCINQAQVAVLCSYDKMSDQVAKALFENQIEFNYLEEELLPQCSIENGRCNIAKQSYQVLVIDEVFEREMQEASRELLENFKTEGVKIVRFSDASILLSELDGLREIFLTSKENTEYIRCTYFEKDGAFYLFITNEGPGPLSFEISVRGKTFLHLEDAYTDQEFPIAPATSHVSLHLEPASAALAQLV